VSDETRGDRPNPVLEALERYEGPLLQYAGHLLGDGDRARDVVQEAFCRLIANPPRAVLGDPAANGQLASWLYTVCRNLAMDVRRKERRMTTLPTPLAENRPAAQPGPDTAAQQAEDTERVHAAIDRLPPAQQEVVRLKFQHELSYRQIAEITGKSVTNVGVTLHHAIKAIRRQLDIQTA